MKDSCAPLVPFSPILWLCLAYKCLNTFPPQKRRLMTCVKNLSQREGSQVTGIWSLQILLTMIFFPSKSHRLLLVTLCNIWFPNLSKWRMVFSAPRENWPQPHVGGKQALESLPAFQVWTWLSLFLQIVSPTVNQWKATWRSTWRNTARRIMVREQNSFPYH